MFTQIASIVILLVVIFLFISRLIPSSVTAILGCALFALFKICTVEEAFSGFSNSIVLLMFGMMIVGIAMSETGFANLIGEKVAVISKHNERLFIFVAGTTSAILSTFLSNTAVIAIFLPLIAAISQSDKNMNRMNITLPVTFGAMFGGVCTLVGSTPQLTANGIMTKMTETELKMFDYTLPGAIVFVVYMLFVLFIGYPIGKKIWGERESVEDDMNDASQQEQKPRYSKPKMITISLIFIATIVSFIGGWIDTSLTAILAALLCMITGCISFKSVVRKMDWSVVFVLAGCLGIASGITKGGAAELMGDVLTKIIGNNVPQLLIFAIFVVMTMLISNFITNSTAVIITLPIALSLCLKMGLNPSLFTMGIVFAANLSYSTPLANAQTAMTLVAGYKFSDYIRYTWILDILVLLTIIFVFPMLMPLTI